MDVITKRKTVIMVERKFKKRQGNAPRVFEMTIGSVERGVKNIFAECLRIHGRNG